MYLSTDDVGKRTEANWSDDPKYENKINSAPIKLVPRTTIQHSPLLVSARKENDCNDEVWEEICVVDRRDNEQRISVLSDSFDGKLNLQELSGIKS